MFTENLLITLIVILMIFITAFVILASLHSKQMRIYYQTQSHLLIEYAQFKHPLYIKLNELKYRIQIGKEKSKEKRRFLSRDNQLLFDKEIYNNIIHTNNFESFAEFLNYTFENFVDKLQQRYPQFSTKDYFLLCLILLDISDIDISNIMNYSYNSIPTTKTRLASKMGIKKASLIRSDLLSLITL